jgi:hypothetical protein
MRAKPLARLMPEADVRASTIELDSPVYKAETFSCNTTVPLGKPVLVGMTSGPAKDGRAADLYLVVELNLAP